MHEYTSRARVPRTRAPLHPLDLPRLSRDTTVRAQRLYELEERFLAVPAGRLDQAPDSDPTRAASSGASAKPFSLLHAIAGTVPPIAPSMSPPVSSLLSARRPVPAPVVDHAAAAASTPITPSPSVAEQSPSEPAAPAAPAAQQENHVSAKAADDTIEAPSEVTPTPAEEVLTPAAEAPSLSEEQPPQETSPKDPEQATSETHIPQAHVDEPAVASDTAVKPERPAVQEELAVDAFAPSSRKPPAAKSSSKRRAAKKQTGQSS